MAGAGISTLSEIVSRLMLRDYYLPSVVQALNGQSFQSFWKGWWWDRHYAAQIEEEMADGLYDPLLQQIATMVLEAGEQQYEERMLVSPNITPYLLDKSYMVQYPVP